jgi:hypothetical protein
MFDPNPYGPIAIGTDVNRLKTSGAVEAGTYRATFVRIPFSCAEPGLD